jgi:hypothetical protein
MDNNGRRFGIAFSPRPSVNCLTVVGDVSVLSSSVKCSTVTFYVAALRGADHSSKESYRMS